MPRPVLIFVCTGNICRSPMAACLMKSALPGKVKWNIRSAGVASTRGQAASREARTAVRKRGLSLERHRSHPLTKAWIDEAAALVVMTRAHRDHIGSRFPEALDRTYLLRSFDAKARTSDIADPIGSSIAVYERTCREIEAALPGLIDYLRTY